MQTNNYVESWHNQLKTIYLKRKRIHRLDFLLAVLTDDVEFDIQQEVKRLSGNVGRMSPAESELRKEEISAETIDCAMLPAMVDQVSGTEFTAASFTVDGLIYEVSFAHA